MIGAIIKINPQSYIIGERSIRGCRHLGGCGCLLPGGADSAYM